MLPSGLLGQFRWSFASSGGNLPDFGCPFIALTQLDVETFAADALPPDLAGTPGVKPGSK